MAFTRILFVSTAMSTLMLCGSAFAQQPQNPSQQGGQEGQQISPREIQGYFRQVENQINQAVQSGNPRQLTQWTQNNIANSANFQAVVEIGGQNSSGSGPKEIRVLSLNKNDMLRRQRLALSLAPQFLSMIDNYELGIRVSNVQPIGNDAAVVRTRISESGTIGFNPGGRQVGRNFGAATQGMGFAEPRNQGDDQDSQAAQPGGGRFQAQNQAQNEAANEADNQGQNQNQSQGQSRRGPRLSFNAEAECTQLVQRDPNSGRLTIGLSNCTGNMEF